MNKMRFEQTGKRKSSTAGFLVTMGLCLCALAVVIWGIFGLDNKKTETEQTTVTNDYEIFQSEDAVETEAAVYSEEQETAVETQAESAPEEKEEQQEKSVSTTETKEVYEDDLGATQVSANTSSLVYTMPVTGKLLTEFSGDELVYDKTMGDWRVHNGIDISAKKGTKVKTAAAGKVTDITTDELLNTTVVILHNDGLLVYYSGLSEGVTVKKGQTVEQGTVIGSVSGVPCEGALDCHIHLSAKKEGSYVNPVTVMGLKLESDT